MLQQATMRCCGLLLLAAMPATGFCGSLGVSPTLVELGAQQRVGVIRVQNTGSTTAIVQMETRAWTQVDGSDHYTDTNELAATPEVFELEPGAQRDVRIGLRSETTANNEQSFRVYVREVLQAAGTDAPQLQFAVRIGVPVFTSQRTRPAGGQLVWRLQAAADGCARLALQNTSATRRRISRLALIGADRIMWESNQPVYVLAGATRVLETDYCGATDAARELQITGETHTEVLTAAR